MMKMGRAMTTQATKMAHVTQPIVLRVTPAPMTSLLRNAFRWTMVAVRVFSIVSLERLALKVSANRWAASW